MPLWGLWQLWRSYRVLRLRDGRQCVFNKCCLGDSPVPFSWQSGKEKVAVKKLTCQFISHLPEGMWENLKQMWSRFFRLMRCCWCKPNAVHYQRLIIQPWSLLQSDTTLWLGRFITSKTTIPNIKPKATQEWNQTSSVNVLKWPSEAPDLRPVQN